MPALSSPFDPFYCQESHFEEEEETEHHFALAQEENFEDEKEEEEEWTGTVSSLVANEHETQPELSATACDNYLGPTRSSAVEWVAETCAIHGFSTQTALLAVNYLDRCFLASSGLRLQEDKPWMRRLAAVACLSLAAKVEETHVPLLLDLQHQAPLFEGKTVRRMELLVLSTLGWRMNPVTPLSLVRRLLPKIPAASGRRREVFGYCEAALLAAIADCRWVRYPPSVWAAAALLHALEQCGAAASLEMFYPLDLLSASKERVESGYQLILELTAAGDVCGYGVGNKRKHFDCSQCSLGYCFSSPPSPNGVIGSCFSREGSSCSGDSLVMWPSSTSSPEPPLFKKPNMNPAKDIAEIKELEV